MFTADGYDKTKSSRFMNIMASMAVFFSKTELVKTYQRHESLNSVTFWLEAARRYNGGNDNGGTYRHRRRISYYVSNFNRIDRRYASNVDDYRQYLKTLKWESGGVVDDLLP